LEGRGKFAAGIDYYGAAVGLDHAVAPELESAGVFSGALYFDEDDFAVTDADEVGPTCHGAEVDFGDEPAALFEAVFEAVLDAGF